MNIGGYKSASITQDQFADWEEILNDHERRTAFYNPERLNLAYETYCYNVEDADKYTSIEKHLATQPQLGLSLKWNTDHPDAGKKRINFVAVLALATPWKVFLFRTHLDTRLPPFLISFLRDRKVAKVVCGEHLSLQNLNRRSQKTFDCTPRGLEEVKKWAMENLQSGKKSRDASDLAYNNC